MSTREQTHEGVGWRHRAMLTILVASPYGRQGSRSAGPAALSCDRKLAELRVVPGLLGCPKRQLMQLLQLTDEASVDDGYVLARAAGLAKQASVIVAGTVLLDDPHGRAWCAGPGQIVGLAALDRRDACGLTATVAGHARLQVLSVPAWQSLRLLAPKAAKVLLRHALG